MLTNRYDVIKSEMIGHKWMEDGPALHFVASLGAVRQFFIRPYLIRATELMIRELSLLVCLPLPKPQPAQAPTRSLLSTNMS